jgi:hypothetical protein
MNILREKGNEKDKAKQQRERKAITGEISKRQQEKEGGRSFRARLPINTAASASGHARALHPYSSLRPAPPRSDAGRIRPHPRCVLLSSVFSPRSVSCRVVLLDDGSGPLIDDVDCRFRSVPGLIWIAGLVCRGSVLEPRCETKFGKWVAVVLRSSADSGTAWRWAEQSLWSRVDSAIVFSCGNLSFGITAENWIMNDRIDFN